jgi:hypothetical protein
MQPTQTLAQHIRRIRAASELLPTAGRESFACEECGGFALAAFAFLIAIHMTGRRVGIG